MAAALLGRKIGMTRLYTEAGRDVPVTILEAGPCFVSQVKNEAVDGYDAIQLAFEDVKARNSTMPLIGHDAKAGLSAKRYHQEFRVGAGQLEGVQLGQKVTVEVFDEVKYVDVTATSKGKGTAGTMKRWGFKGQLASHGVERKHRSPGSVGGRSSNLGTGKPKKGIRMAGHLGAARVTVRSLEVIGQDKDKNLLYVKGPVPGPGQGLVSIRQAKRLRKSKASSLKAKSK